MTIVKFAVTLFDINSVVMVTCFLFCCTFYKKIPKEEKLLFFFLLMWTFFDVLSIFTKVNNYWTLPANGSCELIILGTYFYRRGRAKWIPYLVGIVVLLAITEISILLIYYNVYIACFTKALCVCSIIAIIFHQLYHKELNKQKLLLYYAMILYFSVAFLLFFISFYIVDVGSKLIYIFYIIHVICVAILELTITIYLWKSTRTPIG